MGAHVCLAADRTGAATRDPIFAAIEEHEALMAPVEAEEDEERLSSLLTVADAQFATLLRIRPTTLAGVLCLVDYIRATRDGFGRLLTPDGEEEVNLFLDLLSGALSNLLLREARS